MMSKAKAAQARVFVPLRKVDEEQRLVYGTITQEILDKSGEMMDYDLSKPHFEKWSNDISDATGGLSKGNVRVMHGMVAAGKLTDIAYDDMNKSIDVCAKIVDDAEWNKVVEGVYTGFSVGGAYGKTWTETVDGVKIKKFEAKPMEVSIVDNACVPTATFSLVKADGTVAPVMFKAASAEQTAEIEAADQARIEATAAANDANVEQPTNEQVVNKATEIALAKADGSTWMDHVTDARDELLKAAPKAKDEKDEKTKDDKGDGKTDNKKTGDDKSKTDPKAGDKTEKVTPAGVMQKWTCSDGQAFEKKEDAVAHEESLTEEDPNDPAVKLKKALETAANTIAVAEGSQVEDTVFTDFGRLHKAFLELDQPRQADGTPVLEKGMYTVRRFADVLGDVASLAKTIKAEGVLESGDSEDESVASVLQASLASFGDSFVKYAKNQVAELLAGLDVDLSPAVCYDYYYRAAQADPDNELMKDVCALIEEVKDDVPEVIEELTKAWGGSASVGDDDEVIEGTPLTKAAFDALQKRYDNLEKAANAAVEQVEGLVKRVKVLEDTPMPRAPRGNPIAKEGDTFFGKAETHEDKMSVLHQMLKEHGPDGLATLMIKASQQSGGHQMSLGNR